MTIKELRRKIKRLDGSTEVALSNNLHGGSFNPLLLIMEILKMSYVKKLLYFGHKIKIRRNCESKRVKRIIEKCR